MSKILQSDPDSELRSCVRGRVNILCSLVFVTNIFVNEVCKMKLMRKRWTAMYLNMVRARSGS